MKMLESNSKDNEERIIRCRKARKTILPLKWLSLFFLGVLPFFSLPNWCIEAGLNDGGWGSK